jgi:hypothetical protein
MKSPSDVGIEADGNGFVAALNRADALKSFHHETA